MQPMDPRVTAAHEKRGKDVWGTNANLSSTRRYGDILEQ